MKHLRASAFLMAMLLFLTACGASPQNEAPAKTTSSSENLPEITPDFTFTNEGELQSANVAEGAMFEENRNIVLFGTDPSEDFSDVIMVLSVNPEKKTLSLLSVPRDTKVTIDQSTCKINAVLQMGGDEFAVQSVKDVLDIPIHDYVVVNIDAVETFIDELGGIWFDVPQNMYYQDPEQDLYINIKKGYQLLNGEDAVKVLRFRQYPRGDLDRNQVQQEFLKAVFSQKFQPQYIAKVPAIYGLMQKNVRSSMSLSEILGYLNVISAMDKYTLQTFELPVTVADSYAVVTEAEADVILDKYFR